MNGGMLEFLEVIKAHQLNYMLSLSSMCFIIFVFMLLTGINTTKRKALLVLELSAAILLFADRSAYLFEGDPSRTGFYMARISNFLLFIMNFFILGSYSTYLREVFSETKKLNPKHIRFKIIDFLLLIGVSLVIISQFTDFYYYFDDSNTYYRNDGFIIAFIIPVLILFIFISLNIQFYRQMPKGMRLLLLLFTLNPLISAFFQLIVYGYDAINLTIAAMAILLFIFDLLDVSKLEKNNKNLQDEVETKNEKIINMQENLITSLAVLVESRDNSTGGHILRTREGVRILVEEMKKDKQLNFSEDYCKLLLRAAPMHDIGKIAVEDAILCKKGRFTPEEYEVMKTHAEKGADILHDILSNTIEPDFQTVAVNMAHYHHERWDGSGYPKGLKGEEIPLEARIMAIADVYDALVSKRVYKESMSFEEADKIIMEGMGSQFDKSLEKYYIAARPRLEEYYSQHQ
ncbi:MAG: HD domain-containing protein [Treponema sp.]|nr:HD domain-containing protein [Treponema sp.]